VRENLQRRLPLPASAPTIAELKSVKVLAGLDHEVLDRIIAVSEVLEIKPRTQVVASRVLGRRVVFVVAGNCRLNAISPVGACITMSVLSKGDDFGIAEAMQSGEVLHSLQRLGSETGARLIAIDRGVFRRLVLETPSLSSAVCRRVCEALFDLNNRFYELATLDVRGRVLSELSRLAARAEAVGGELVIEAAPTHSELADKIGAAREAVSRALLEFEKDDLVEVGRRRIAIKDLPRLRRLEEESAGARLYQLG
jgi:CRP/FNR family transcriptional regulator